MPARLQVAWRIADVRAGMRVLDMGCGRGEMLVQCAEAGATACGVDYSEAALALAHQAIEAAARPGLTLYCCNARALPFREASFDRVLMLDLVEHLHPWELALVFKEVHRVLRASGYLVIHTMPNLWYYHYGYRLYRLFQRLRGSEAPPDPRQRWQYVEHVHVNEQTPLTLKRSLQAVGFRPRVWLYDYHSYQSESPLVRLVFRATTGLPVLKLIFCNDIFAVARKQ